MISKYSSSRTLKDNLVLGSLTSFTAGAVNVLSYLLFFSFTSNVTGYYALFAAEFVKGNFYQVGVVMLWITLFFTGGFVSNLIVISMINRGRTYFAHLLPVAIEIICIAAAGAYAQHSYGETLSETEALLSVLIFAMGIQNGFTASISNFAVKTTHLTGATTDMGILLAMFTHRQFRENAELRAKAMVLLSVSMFYVAGGVIAAFLQFRHGYNSFYFTCAVLLVVLAYDFSRIRAIKLGKTSAGAGPASLNSERMSRPERTREIMN